jgi:glycosyltransferase involved in cell wall biosynthesis
MHLLHISWEFPPTIVGGLGTFTMELTRQLVVMGNEVTVYTLNRENKYPTRDNWKGVDVHRPMIVDFTHAFNIFAGEELKRWGEGLKFFSDVAIYNILSASKAVNQQIRKDNTRFDVVDAHDWLGAMAGIAIKEETGLPLVFHVHSTEKGRSMGKGSRVVEDIEYMGADKADCVVTVSHAMRDHLISIGFPGNKITVCWNGVDEKKYSMNNFKDAEIENLRKRYGIKKEESMLLFVGRLTPVKGAQNLVEAMPMIIREYPNTKLVLLGVGELENDIRNRIKALGLDGNVILRSEFVEEHERILHYAASDVVVLPSFYEPFGIVCTEAMSMGKPVVVGAKGISGFKEQVIPDGENQCGVHVDPHNPDDIAWGVSAVLCCEEKRIMMGKNARERVLREFTWENIAKKTYNIYASVDGVEK